MAPIDTIQRSDAPSKPVGPKSAGGKPEATGFGTFGGVFTPCTLTILGVIMFLRFASVRRGYWGISDIAAEARPCRVVAE